MTDTDNINGIQIAKASSTIDLDVSRQCAETLLTHYPGYMWAVNVENETGMVQVRNMSLSGTWGFNLHMINVINDPSLKKVINAGGEILERYNLARSAANEDKINDISMDFAGRLKMDAA